MEYLECVDVVKRYGDYKALDGVSVRVKRGAVAGLLGPNGAGKTSLIRIVNRITAPDSGGVWLDGKPLEADASMRIGYLPEERGLYPKMKVGEQALYLAGLKGLSRGEAMRRLKYYFEKFEMVSWWEKRVEELSKGMQQKMQFVIAVVHEPELLICDEPFSGFDPINAQLLKNELLELNSKGMTILLSTHQMPTVEELCSEICLMNRSRVILAGEVGEIKNRFKRNCFRIKAMGDEALLRANINGLGDVERWQSVGNGAELDVILSDGISTNQLLSAVMRSNEVHFFQELLPSMEEIFIEKVKEN